MWHVRDSDTCGCTAGSSYLADCLHSDVLFITTLFIVLQHSETPSPRNASHARTSASGPPHAVYESPALVSPGQDLIAQTGAMLLDNPSMRFNSPCHRFQSGTSAADLQDLAAHRPPSRQQSSTEARPSRPTQTAAAGSTVHMTQATDRRQQQPHLPFLQAQHAQQGPVAAVRQNDDQDWDADAGSALHRSLSGRPEEMEQLCMSPVPMFQTDHSRQQASSQQLAMQMLPVASSSYLAQTGLRWDASNSDPLLSAGLAGMYGGDIASSSAQSTFLPALMLQRQHTQAMPGHSAGQPLPNRGTAMEQLALSTAATADLLAGMAANSSHAHPDSASDLILAASATLQAFARAAHSAQGPFGGQQSMGVAADRLLANSGSGVAQLSEQRRQQLAFMQQQWQLQHQQQGWPGINHGP